MLDQNICKQVMIKLSDNYVSKSPNKFTPYNLQEIYGVQSLELLWNLTSQLIKTQVSA